MEKEIGNQRKTVSKIFVIVIALAMIVPIGLMITVGGSPETPMTRQAPVVENFYAGNTQITLAATSFDVNVGPQGLPDELCIDKYSDKVDGYYIVKFNDAVKQIWKAEIHQLGALIGDYVPYNAFMVRMSDDVRSQVENLDFVQYVGIYQPAYKISKPLLTDMTLRSDLHVEDALAFINWDNLWQKAKVIGQGQKKAVSIAVHEYENPYNVAALIAKAGGTIIGVSEGGQSVRAEVSTEGIQVLSFLNDVQYIQPWYPQEMLLSQANNYEQADSAPWQPVWDAGIHGEGVIVATSDTGLDTDHVMFFDPAWAGAVDWTGASPSHRKVVRYEQWTDDWIDDALSQHGTRTAGYCCGDGDYVGNSNINRFGMAYHAKISFHDIGYDETLRGIPQDLKDMFQIQYEDGARLCSNSWGQPVDSGDPPDTRTYLEGTYSEDSTNSDWFMWMNKEFLVFFSAGNDRIAPTHGGPAYNCTVTPPSTGKNMICVGAHSAGAGWNSMESYSSWGPTRGASGSATDGTGRLKPDLASSAPATAAFGDRNRDGNQDSNYQSMAGTSTSGPVAMGGGALVHQYYLDGYWPTGSEVSANGFEPSAALVKASMINGARWGSGANANQHDYNLNGHFMDYPNNDQGWGMTDLGDSLYFDTPEDNEIREMEIDDNQVGLITGQFREYEFNVEDASNPLEISLVWTDYKGTMATFGALVNDLDLTITNPVGTTYWGNNYGASSRQSDSTNHIGGWDHINNVECALVSNPMIGTWKIRIDATNVPIGPQPYALVLTGDFDEGYGWVKLDKSVYAKGDTVSIQVKDTPGSGTLPVDLVSSTGDTEALTLNEVFLNAGIYTVNILTEISDPVVDDGAISIEDDGWILASYDDASPPHTSYANATTDVSGPEITDVHASDITNTAAIIYWDTDVPATSQVYYGTTPALGSQSDMDPDMVMAGAFPHKVSLTGLTAFTSYYYDVESTSIGGVTTRDSNGGTHYMFTTVDDPDVLIVQEHSDLESSAQQVDDWRLSLDHFGWSYVVWETVLYDLPSVAALNTAKLVYWDVGEGYPQLGADERALLQTWVNQPGQQLWYQTGQDVGWDMSSDGLDGPGTDVDNLWRDTYLRFTYRKDDADGGGGNEAPPPFQIVGTAHPISSSHPGNGVGLDLEQDIYGPARFWPDDIINDLGGQSPAPWDYNRHSGGGDAGGIAYNSVSYKLALEAFAHAMIQDDGTYGTPGYVFGVDLNLDRATIADYTLQWLFGEDHPDVHVDAPNSGTYSGTSVPITWTVANAITIDIQISQDGGQSYEVVALGLPTAPANWNWDTTTTGVYGPGRDFPNGEHYRVKVLGRGTGLNGFDISDNNFTIDNGPSGDDLGPMIWAGSVTPSPIPVEKGQPLHVTAIADDSNKGNSNIFHVEYYIDGETPAELIGDMDPADGTFDSALEDAVIDYNTASLLVGTHTIHVRAQDFASNWGGFEVIEFDVILGDNTPPTINVTVPNTGLVWMGGSVQTIEWTMSDLQDPNSALNVTLNYSTNGPGGPWTFIDTVTGVETYDWNPVPLADSIDCYIQAYVLDTGGMDDEDESDVAFTIDSTAPAEAANVRAELTAPNHVTIYWNGSVSPDVDHYEIYYRLNGWDSTGDTYNFLIDKGLSISHLHLNVGINNPSSYYWQVRTFDVAGHETRSNQQAGKTGSTQSTFANPTGWFILGSHLQQSSTLITDVIRGAGLPANWNYAQVYDAVNGDWESHLKGRPDSKNDLTDITNKQGFWLHLTGSTRFATAGYVEDMIIDLEAGWNLVPYPFADRTMTTANIMTHLSANCPNYVGMEILDIGDPYRLKVPDGTETLAHGSGFWVQLSSSGTWTVLNY